MPSGIKVYFILLRKKSFRLKIPRNFKGSIEKKKVLESLINARVDFPEMVREKTRNEPFFR